MRVASFAVAASDALHRQMVYLINAVLDFVEVLQPLGADLNDEAVALLKATLTIYLEVSR